MITARVITAALNDIILETLRPIYWLLEPLALTPEQRWDAARSWFGTNIITDRWFIIISLTTLLILIILFLVVSLQRKIQEQKITEQLFAEYANKRGLSEHERQILLDVASKAGLKRSEAIFTMGGAFESGASRIIEENLTQQKAEEVAAKDNLRILSQQMELSFLREKLGFQKRRPASIGSLTKRTKTTSRQIPVGKKLHMTRRRTRGAGSIESTVMKNDDIELMVKLAMPVESSLGELWRVRYYFGASVWEFDTSVISYSGDILVLNHSDNIRFINRRRFLRVPVNKPAFIARFPFAKTVSGSSDISEEGSEAEQGSADASVDSWGPPEFIPAVVTELAGPGLRIEAPLEIKVGERILVVLRLDEERDRDSVPDEKANAQQSAVLVQEGKAPTSRIVEDIGEVRHTKAIKNGLSIAVELTGLSDSDVNELIRATNAASVRAVAEGQDNPVSASNEQGAEGRAAEPAAVQGV
jgi:hypothetical protein